MVVIELLGYVASSLVLATFCMRTMLSLRIVAIVSNLAFITYAALARIDPVLLLHAVLLPMNVWRLIEIWRQKAPSHSRFTLAAFLQMCSQGILGKSGRPESVHLPSARGSTSLLGIHSQMAPRQKNLRWSVRSFLKRSGLWLSKQASFTLITLVIFLGIAVGLWRGRPVDGTGPQGLSTRTACSQISIDFAASATASQIKGLLRAQGGYIVHGPDEFGVYQLRFTEVARTGAAERLRADPVIASVQNHANCP